MVDHAFLSPTRETPIPPSTSNPIHPIHHHAPMFGHPDIIRLCEIFAQHEVGEVERFRNSH